MEKNWKSRVARPLRIEFAGALYHITARGNERRSILFCDEDRFQFLSRLDEVCERFNWRCHAYCQMSNHYHLLYCVESGTGVHGVSGEGLGMERLWCDGRADLSPRVCDDGLAALRLRN